MIHNEVPIAALILNLRVARRVQRRRYRGFHSVPGSDGCPVLANHTVRVSQLGRSKLSRQTVNERVYCCNCVQIYLFYFTSCHVTTEDRSNASKVLRQVRRVHEVVYGAVCRIYSPGLILRTQNEEKRMTYETPKTKQRYSQKDTASRRLTSGQG